MTCARGDCRYDRIALVTASAVAAGFSASLANDAKNRLDFEIGIPTSVGRNARPADFWVANARIRSPTEQNHDRPGWLRRALADASPELFSIAMIASVSVCCWQATQGAKPKDEMLELYGLFVDAVEKVELNYVRPVSRRELLENALEGMLQNLDRTRPSSTPASGNSSDGRSRASSAASASRLISITSAAGFGWSPRWSARPLTRQDFSRAIRSWRSTASRPRE